jgi:hypothetical protein
LLLRLLLLALRCSARACGKHEARFIGGEDEQEPDRSGKHRTYPAGHI